MMKAPVIYFTDLHCNKYTQFSEHHNRLNNCLRVLTDVFKYAEHYNADIYFGGDFGDLPKYIYIIVLKAIVQHLSKLFKKYPDRVIYAISGNHDYGTKNYWEKDAETLIEILAAIFPGKFVSADNRIFLTANNCYVAGIPFYEHAEHFSKALDAMHAQVLSIRNDDPKAKATLLIHQTPRGIFNPHIKTDTDPDDPRYDIFDMVLCGHIHRKQFITPKFLVGGNPLHRDLGDLGDEKGIWLLDGRSPAKTVTFITRKGRYPEFVKLKESEINEDVKKAAFVVPDMANRQVIVSGSANWEEFSSNLPMPKLLENYWRQTDKELDEKLLKTGLSLCP